MTRFRTDFLKDLAIATLVFAVTFILLRLLAH